MASIRCGHCSGRHGSVADVRACSQGQRVATDHEVDQLSGQAFLDGRPKAHEHCQGTHNTDADRERCETLPKRVAEAEARREFRQLIERSSLGQTREPVREGFYLVDGDILKVQIAVHGSGRLYAKRLHIDELTDLELDPELRRPGQKVCHGTWVYEPGLIKAIRPEHRLTADKAAELGKLYGMCVRCGRTLTKEESIERGMGDICAGKGF